MFSVTISFSYSKLINMSYENLPDEDHSYFPSYTNICPLSASSVHLVSWPSDMLSRPLWFASSPPPHHSFLLSSKDDPTLQVSVDRNSSQKSSGPPQVVYGDLLVPASQSQQRTWVLRLFHPSLSALLLLLDTSCPRPPAIPVTRDQSEVKTVPSGP